MDINSTASSYELTTAAQQDALDRLITARTSGSESAIRSAEHAVISTHLAFATALGRRYRGRGVDQDDLQQLARLGLVKAVKRWLPDVGNDFAPYAYPTILGEIKRYFRDHSTIIRAPRGLRELHTETDAVAEGLEQRLGRPANDHELAEAVGVTPQRIRQQRAAVQACRSLSLDLRAVQGSADQVPSESAESELGRVENLMMVRQAIVGLTDRDRQVLALRYFQEKSQAQIAAVIGVSQMQVSRILRGILTKLRDELADRPALQLAS
ncbi:RNA polymerase sigma-B factor [Nakamurella panacisegetis]|uniref:RNA polymerase sigma-B factor n=1 Tax=Nakamurella panacisegetis TaxID=1090615 RepID=A0A1H0SVN7_9ACTN|nr:sigma-70 family RNA polymerase sigma factor [Nakamurella panacisegetis]SDP45827.1 RNA polymerase sigma-B factor [Nakamurella panacisegetis]